MKKNLNIVGVDIKKNVIRICWRKRGKINIDEMAVNGSILDFGKIKDPAVFKEALTELLRRNKIGNAYVVFAAPNSKLLIKHIPLDNPKSEKTVREAVFLALGDSISLPFERPIFDLLALKNSTPSKGKLAKQPKPKVKKVKGKKKSELEPKVEVKEAKTIKIKKDNRFTVNGAAPVLITDSDALESMCDAFADVGLNNYAVDFSSLVYTEMFRKKINWSENFILIELDAGTANLTIYEELLPVFIQEENYNPDWRYVSDENGKVRNPQYSGAAEVERLQELGGRLSDLCDYFKQEISAGKEISQIYVVGGHPNLRREVIQIFQSMVDVPVKALAFSREETKGEGIPERYNLAAGLSLKEA